MAETAVSVAPKPLDPERRSYVERSWAEIDGDRIRNLLVEMVNIPSPTGEERRLAQSVASYMRGAGLDAICQPIDEHQANAVGRVKGKGGGPHLLLYAPLDTDFTGIEEEDCPGVGLQLPADLQPKAMVADGYVVGLGAVNPKGFATCVITAAETVKRAGIPLRGDLVVGLGAGGMPSNRRPGQASPRWNVGQGSGCSFLLEQGIRGDFAIIAKPGWAVAWEEVGLCWFKVLVTGNLGYVGTRRSPGYKNPIMDATVVIQELEEWFAVYAERNRSGLVAPQGVVGAIAGGWTHKPSFIPATCSFYVDLRVSPRTDTMAVKRQFAEAIAGIQTRHPGIAVDWEMFLSIPGSHTTPQNWIVQSCMRAWELVEGQPHRPIFDTSGATDANILRGRGIPTARIGLPRVSERDPASPKIPRRAASVASMERLVRCLVYSIVDTCTRDCGEVGL